MMCNLHTKYKEIMPRILLLTLVIALNISYARFLRLGACFLAPDFWYDCFDVHIVDTLAYLASEDLAIINIAQPDSPFIIARLDTTTILRNAIEPRYPYSFTMGTGFIGSFDVTDPSTPIFLDSIGIPFLYNDLEIKDSYAYITGDHMHLVNINTPDSLFYVTTVDSTALAGRLIRSENYLYELISICSLFVYDISNPSNPQKIGSCPLPTAYALGYSEPQYRDSIIYYPRAELGNATLTLNTVDVSDPYNPVFITSSSSVGTDINYTYDLALSGDFAYATFNVNTNDLSLPSHQGDEPWISVFDISNPNNMIPVWHNQNYPLARAIGIDARADTIYLCDGDSFYIYIDTLWTGLDERKLFNVKKPRIICFPNPCYDSIWLIKSGKNSDSIFVQNISAYDVAGCLIYEFPPTTIATNKRILWDLTTNGGKKITGGVYFIKCRYNDKTSCMIKIIKL